MWDWDFALSILPDLLAALPVTVEATLLGFLAALVLGLLVALARRAAFRPLSLAAAGFVEFVRGTPLLVQLYFAYFSMPYLGLALPAFTTGVLVLGLHYSTYVSEVYRAGIDGVPKGQWEAARALNFAPLQTWTRIILPQALPPIVPVLGNYLITMFKETPLLMAITVSEMMLAATDIGSRSFRYVEPFTLLGLFFLFLSYTSSLLVQRLERRFGRAAQ